jgi:Rho family, other
MSYSKSHVILIAFAIDTPDSLDNVSVKVLQLYPHLRDYS